MKTKGPSVVSRVHAYTRQGVANPDKATRMQLAKIAKRERPLIKQSLASSKVKAKKKGMTKKEQNAWYR